MNQLSWLLYWADVLPAVSTWIALICFLLTLASLALLIFHLSCCDLTTEQYARNPEGDRDYSSPMVVKPSDEALAARKVWWVKITFPLCLILWGSAFLVPTKETFYMIAASEAGEQAMQAPEFDKVRQIINKYLDDALKVVPATT